jgi:hypothetical protein
MFGYKNAGFMGTLARLREHRRDGKSMNTKAGVTWPDDRIPLDGLVRRETFFAEPGIFRWNR